MLSNHIVRKIEDQIARELRTADSICSDPDEKMEALDRIVKLKAILNPETIIVVKDMEEAEEDTLSSTLLELVRSFRKR